MGLVLSDFRAVVIPNVWHARDRYGCANSVLLEDKLLLILLENIAVRT
jgi:hypothetical protein